jgi:hypothetical protein
MRKVVEKSALPLRVAYGIDPEVAIPLATHIDSCIVVDVGWMKLHFGYDSNWSEVVYAIAGKKTFLLSTAQPDRSADSKSSTRSKWVYAIGFFSPDLTDGAPQPTILKYAGFHVEHGTDIHGSNYLWVFMPSAELQLLFRNPTLHLDAVDSHPTVIQLADGVEIGPFEGADDLVRTKDHEPSGDPETAAIVSSLPCFGGDRSICADSTGDADLSRFLRNPR